MTAPPTPPEYGQGPANFADAGGGGPFSAFDNSINYQNMLRYQMVTQYQQQNITPYSLPMQMQRRIMTGPRYSYGVPGGQDRSYYNRQAELNRSAYSGAIASAAVGWGGWSAAGGGAALAGFGTLAAGIAIPLLATAPLYPMISKRMNEVLDRQKYMQSIALDLEVNREKLGMRGLSYNEASRYGSVLSSDVMSRGTGKGAFFNTDQLMRIQKIGIASGILTAKGPREGTLRQYRENVKELTDATEDIVKTLQTTIEGAMSFIKEANQIGFKNIPQIRSQMRMAKAIGATTGMGFQNAMQIGAAGAQAVQGTPWAAHVGASMFQMGAVQANAIANTSRAGAYAVERAGGVAQAGATIAATHMNIMQSGIGTRMAAYAMNPDGTVNQGALDRMLGGGLSPYEVVSGANRVGYAMGTNRVRFDMFKEDLLNRMSDVQRGQFANEGFNLWRRGRGGGVENQAYAFARQFTNDSVSRRLMYQSLLAPSPMARLSAEAGVQRFISGPRVGMRAASARGIGGAIVSGYRGLERVVGGAVEGTMGFTSAGVQLAGEAADYTGGWFTNRVNDFLGMIGVGDQYGYISRNVNYGNTEQAMLVSQGLARRGDPAAQFEAWKRTGFRTRRAGGKPTVETGVDYGDVILDLNRGQMNTLWEKLTAMGDDGAREIKRKFETDNELRRMLRLSDNVKNVKDFPSFLQSIRMGFINEMKPTGEKFVDVSKRLGVDPGDERLRRARLAIFERQGDTTVNQALNRAGVKGAVRELVQWEEKQRTIADIPYTSMAGGNYARAMRAARQGIYSARAQETGFLQGVSADLSQFAESAGRTSLLGVAAGVGAWVSRAAGNIAGGAAYRTGAAENVGAEVMTNYQSAMRKRWQAGSGIETSPYTKGEKEALNLYKRNEQVRSAIDAAQFARSEEGADYAIKLADMYRQRAMRSGYKGATFTGEDVAKAMRGGREAMQSFFGKYVGQFEGKSVDVLMSGIDKKAGIDEQQKIFWNKLTIKNEVPLNDWEARRRNVEEGYEKIAGIRGQMAGVAEGKVATQLANNKEYRDLERKLEVEQAKTQKDLELFKLDISMKGLNNMGGGGNQAGTAAAPILNYWNNRWLL